ncbi:MAG: YegS/Rv2252/BmrU family lipid kinase [Clostridia bacterium]|nr:YegS/Rv2252/BmrU family lipid kinase [Clostridia bacterium]
MASLKHYFVVNPVSGKNNKVDVVNDLIIPTAEKLGIDYEVYNTTCAGDGQRFVKETAAAANGAPVRFYAVGGDGTLYEVINGAFGFENAEVAAVPKGSGNDWVRLLGDVEAFTDIEGNINGTPTKLDCIKVNDEIAINQFSMGFDAEACSEQGKMKKIPGAVGHMTYTLAGFYCMITRVKFKYKVWVDDKEVTGPFIQTTVCNGRYYGSGIQVAPFALPDDGKLDVVAIKRYMSWPVLFKVLLINWQSKGDFWKRSYVEYLRGEKVVIESEKPIQINVDGECHAVTRADAEIVKNGLTFVMPKGATYPQKVASGEFNNTIQQTYRNKGFMKKFLSLKPYNLIVNKLFGKY